MRRRMATAGLVVWLVVVSAGTAWAHGEASTRGNFEIGQLVVALVPLAAGALGMMASNAIDGRRSRGRERRGRRSDRPVAGGGMSAMS